MGRHEKPIAAVSKLTGVSTDTIRAWERRYRLVTPDRDAAGIRRYSERDVERIKLAQRATQLGHPIGSLARLSDSEIERLIDQHRRNAGPREEPRASESPADAAYRAICAFDVPSATAMLNAAALHMEPKEFVLSLLAPLLRRVGDGWAGGDLGVAQEHAASNLVRDMIGTFRRTRASSLSRSCVLFATPPEELHDLGLGLAACLVALQGAQTLFFGAQLPADELVMAATRLSARAVVISSTIEQPAGVWEAYIRVLDIHLPARAALWVGGPGAARMGNVLSGRIKRLPTLEGFAEHLEAQRGLWLQ